jgi:hypothetical protein
MSEAKWQCNYDDHINKFSEQTCEICGNHRPVILDFTYLFLEEFGTIKVCWSIENFKKGNLIYGRKNIDITESIGEIVVKEIRHKEKIVLNTENDTCEINEEKIILLKEPEILKFFSNTLKVLETSFIDLTWETKNATNVKISDLGSVSLSGFIKSTKPKSFFKLIVENEVGKTEQEIKIDVLPLPKIHEFKSKKQKIEYGKEVELNWNIDHIEKAELLYDGIREPIELKGNKILKPEKDTKYKLVVTALDGKTLEEIEIQVFVYKPIEIHNFSTSLDFVIETVKFKLSWDIREAKELKLFSNIGMVKDVSAINFIELEAKKGQELFWIEAKNDLFDQVTNKLKVKVEPLPGPIDPIISFGDIQLPSIDLTNDLNLLGGEIIFKNNKLERILGKKKIRFELGDFIEKLFKELNV